MKIHEFTLVSLLVLLPLVLGFLVAFLFFHQGWWVFIVGFCMFIGFLAYPLIQKNKSYDRTGHYTWPIFFYVGELYNLFIEVFNAVDFLSTFLFAIITFFGIMIKKSINKKIHNTES